ncbi:MAG TPA: hypothetical protein VK531_10225 [Gemmatimonadales bacterium]|nr:hypothetical protein [Gemmatimonadales bacterium]
MRPRLAVLVALGCLACGGGRGSQTPAPQSPQQALERFMAAVKANDQRRMGDLWGSERGPASSWMKSDDLKQRLAVFQIYLNHVGYRVVEGPTPVSGHDRVQTFRVELQRSNSCTVVFPVEMVRAKSGGWLVNAVDLASLPNPARSCAR